MILSSDTFLDDNFLKNVIFLSNVHHNELTKDYCFSMGYLINTGEMKAFELRFDNEEEAKTCREEVKSRILIYR